jgi:hypothetical protein
MEMNWSRWFHCESSFGLLLVPNQPGIFALAEEIVQPAGPHRRMLAVFEVAEADDLSRAMSRLFAVGSPWREKLAQTRCYVCYAIAPSIADRRAAATALKNWLSAQREVASQIFEQPLVAAEAKLLVAEQRSPIIAATDRPITAATDGWSAAAQAQVSPREMKTIAERAVDRVTHGMRLSKAFPAEF